MGRSYTPKYVMQMDGYSAQEWSVKRHGRATWENLEKYIRAFVDSQKAGGVNEHLASAGIKVPRKAVIRLNSAAGSFLPPLVEWNHPKFYII